MKKKYLAWALTMSLGAFYNSAKAQEAIPAAGIESTGSGGTVSSTIGQVNYITNQNSNGSVSQGVQQAYTVIVIDGVEPLEGITLSVKIFGVIDKKESVFT